MGRARSARFRGTRDDERSGRLIIGASRTWLVAPPVAWAGLVLLGFGARQAFGRFSPFFSSHNDDEGRLSAIALMVHGLGVWLPLGYVLVAGWLARRGERRAAALVLAPSLAVLLVSAWAFLVEPATLEVRRYTIESPRAFERPFTILHTSDLQTDGACRRERLAEELAREGEWDLAVFTGDFTNGCDDPSECEGRIAAANTFLRALHARHGVYVVLGDWDGWGADWPELERRILEGTEARVLRNATEVVVDEGVRLVVHGAWFGGEEGARPEIPDLSAVGGLRLVLVHQPDVAVDLVRPGGADLILAGHTHGGQVHVPLLGPLTTRTRLGVEGGQVEVAGVPMLISRGIGMRGGVAPRIRLLCPPEVSIVTVRRPGHGR